MDSKGGPTSRRSAGTLLTLPNNVGPRSTPNYESLVAPAIYSVKDGTKVFAGQRDDPFYVDLGGTFDLIGFRSAPRRVQHGRRRRPEGLQRQHDRHPGADHAADRDQERPDRRQRHQLGGRRLRDRVAPGHHQGRRTRWQQVSRLAEPLINEVVIPLGKKDLWNRSDPADDKQFERFYLKPELAGS